MRASLLSQRSPQDKEALSGGLVYGNETHHLWVAGARGVLGHIRPALSFLV